MQNSQKICKIPRSQTYKARENRLVRLLVKRQLASTKEGNMTTCYYSWILLNLFLATGTDSGPVKGHYEGILKNASSLDGKLTSNAPLNLTREEIELKISIKHLELEEKLLELLDKTLKGTIPDPTKQQLINTAFSFLALLLSGVLVAVIARALMLRFERREKCREAEMTAKYNELAKLKDYGQTERPGTTIDFQNCDCNRKDMYLGQELPRCKAER